MIIIWWVLLAWAGYNISLCLCLWLFFWYIERYSPNVSPDVKFTDE